MGLITKGMERNIPLNQNFSPSEKGDKIKGNRKKPKFYLELLIKEQLSQGEGRIPKGTIANNPNKLVPREGECLEAKTMFEREEISTEMSETIRKV